MSIISNSTGQGVNALSRGAEDTVNSLKETSYYKEVQDKLSAEREKRGIWVKTKDQKGQADYYLDVTALSTANFFTSVKTREGAVQVPLAIKMILGQKIQIKDKVEGLIEAYKKSVIQSTSHNLILSRLAGMKMAACAFILSLLGMPVEELKKLKKQAIEDAIAENAALFEENTYNMELLEILGGGSGVHAKAQRSILDEIQKQILTQAKRLNIDDYYTKEKILETKIRVCKDIMFKFREEEMNLQYELDYYSTVN